VLSAWARRDVEKLAGFDEQDSMPDTSRNHEGLSWSKLDLPRRLAVLEYDPHLAGDEEEKLVTVGVHLAAVRCIAGHHGGANREPVNTRGRARVTGDPFGISRPIQTDRVCCQIDRTRTLV
jgi:hypothetical protein